MATFTSWAALRTSIKDAIATHIAGKPCVGSFTMGNHTMNYISVEELERLYKMTYTLENLESSGSKGSITSYGRYSRY